MYHIIKEYKSATPAGCKSKSIYWSCDSKECAEEKAKMMNDAVTEAERNFLGTHFSVVEACFTSPAQVETQKVIKDTKKALSK